MAKKTRATGFDAVRKIGLALPDVTEGTSYGAPSLKVGERMFVCIPTNKAAEPDSLVVRLGFDDRDALLEEEPQIYYLRDHYVPYPCVLVRLSRIRPDALADLIRASWEFERQIAKQPKRPRGTKGPGGPGGPRRRGGPPV